MGQILDGEVLASKIKAELKERLNKLNEKGVQPQLVAVLIGDNAGAKIYANQQKKACEEIGIKYNLAELLVDTTEEQAIEYVKKLNSDKNVTGVIIQMPFPPQINARRVQTEINPQKDVEGIHPANIGLLVYGRHIVAPCTALGAIELLKSSGVDLKGKETVVIGHSEIVGKPVMLLLLQSLLEAPTVTVCHIATKDLTFHTKRAEILIVAAGKAGLIKADMIKDGAIVIDIGINRVPILDENGQPVLDDKGKKKMKTVGDVEFDKAKDKCSFISPVPGGVGPLTVAMLLKNIITCAEWQLT